MPSGARVAQDVGCSASQIWVGELDGLATTISPAHKVNGEDIFNAHALSISGQGDTFFQASLDRTGLDRAIVKVLNGEPQFLLVEDDDDTLLDIGEIPTFLSSYRITSSGRIVIDAGIGPSSQEDPFGTTNGLWIEDDFSVLRHIVATGDNLEVAPGDVRRVERIIWYAVNDIGQVAYAINFADSSGVFITQLEPIPEPCTLLLAAGTVAVCLVLRIGVPTTASDTVAYAHHRIDGLGTLLIVVKSNCWRSADDRCPLAFPFAGCQEWYSARSIR